MKIYARIKGSATSGNWGHSGREGQVGGSVSRNVAMSIRTGQDWQSRQAAKVKGVEGFRSYNETDNVNAVKRYQEARKRSAELNATGEFREMRKGDQLYTAGATIGSTSLDKGTYTVDNISYVPGDISTPVKVQVTLKDASGNTLELDTVSTDALGWYNTRKTVPASTELKQRALQGVDAPFKRGKDGVYRSENGLAVKFKRITSSLYAYVHHNSSDALVISFTSRPIKNRQVALEAARKMGTKINFNLSRAELDAVLQDAEFSSFASKLIREAGEGV